MVSFSECVYRGYRITAWAQASHGASRGFAGRAVVAGTAAAVMDFRLPVPIPDPRVHTQPATARHVAEAAARAYIDELRQAHTIHDAREARNESAYVRAREHRPSRAAA
jgi:hypothetical protein